MTTSSGESMHTAAHAGPSGLLAALAGWALSIATVAVLGGIGWLGHATHWSFSFDHDHGGHDAGGHVEAPTASATRPPADTVHFESPTLVERSGIQVVPVERRAVTSEVFCNGVVAYDEHEQDVTPVAKSSGIAARPGSTIALINVFGPIMQRASDFGPCEAGTGAADICRRGWGCATGSGRRCCRWPPRPARG